MTNKAPELSLAMAAFDSTITGMYFRPPPEMKIDDSVSDWKTITFDEPAELKAGDEYVIAQIGDEVLLLKVLRRAKVPES